MKADFAFSQAHIVMVDDDEDDVFITLAAMRRAGLKNKFQVVENGRAALQYLRKQPPYIDARRPDLLLLDINMPVMNGFDVLLEMKHDSTLASIPVIMLSTSGMESDIAKSYKMGACSYITKPNQYEDRVRVFSMMANYWGCISRIPSTRMR